MSNVIKDLADKPKYDMDDLLTVMRILREKCPWDREQTHESIRKNLIEEAYEVAEAIDERDADMLAEELGDLLLQVVFHAEIERGVFDFSDVCDGICRKLVMRHPHIFSDTQAGTSEQVLANWEDIKKDEKRHVTYSQTVEAVPKSLPGLMRAQKMASRAAKCGFDRQGIDGVLDKLAEEVDEFRRAVKSGDANHAREELGDVFMAAANAARFMDADAEEVLAGSCEKFSGRFGLMERLAEAEGFRLDELDDVQLDRLWEQAKSAETQQ